MSAAIFVKFACLIFSMSMSIVLSDELPNNCKIDNIKEIYDYEQVEKTLIDKEAIKCNIDKSYSFDFKNDSSPFYTDYACNYLSEKRLCNIDILYLEWPKNELIILDKKFDFPRLFEYLVYLVKISMHIVNLNGIDLNLVENNSEDSTLIYFNYRVQYIRLFSCKLDFYINTRLVNSCSDILVRNITVKSIFQISVYGKSMSLIDVEYKRTLCPLIFNNTVLEKLSLTPLIDSFYKTNVVKFSNETLENINVEIIILDIVNVENINLDSTFLNPYVFKHLFELDIMGYVNKIETDVFSQFEELKLINIWMNDYRKMIHRNGIGWIKEINKNISVDFISNPAEINKYMHLMKLIQLNDKIDDLPSKEFPNQDFCIYRDFPFKQLVVLVRSTDTRFLPGLNITDYSCTYFWLTRHLIHFPDYVWQSYKIIYEHGFIASTYYFLGSIPDEYVKSRCDFEKRIELCNKSNYQVKDIWSSIDFYFLNKKLKIAIKISSYLFSFLGIFTNTILIWAILSKNNSDLFKGFKHYSYLCTNSIFALTILIINIFSWTTECFYPFEVFCPSIRTLMFFQYFKIIFKSIIANALNFMCNFTYMAFAFNRINTIDKEMKFLTKISIKTFIGITLVVSLILSAIKFFKYSINPGIPYANYPISNELDIFMRNENSELLDAYFAINSICDLLNYVLFVLICLIIDIYMLVKLRQVLADKTRKLKNIYKKEIFAVKKKENDDVMKKAIKMVLISNCVGLFLKIPSSFLPIINAYAQFFNSYKLKYHWHWTYFFSEFFIFYNFLLDSGFYSLLIDISELLYNISITVQILIYRRFDKKISNAIDRILTFKKKNVSEKKN